MADIEKYQRIYRDALQQVVAEPIVAVALLNRSGQTVSDALLFASPLAAMVKGRSDKAGTGGLPPCVAVALTASAVHLFAYKPKGFGIKVKGEPVVWERRAVRFTPSGGGHTDAVQVELLETGEVLRLENPVMVGMRGFNDEFFAHLGQQVG